MQLQLDPASPVPLYHQLAEALRYRIATGALEPGVVLPSLRDAARQWRLNLHTVRHAYARLAAEGLVHTQVPHGTVILGRASRPAVRRQAAADRFLARMVREAGDRYGLTPDELRRRLLLFGGAPDATAEPVYLVECSETQAADLALQVSARWNITARGWSLERPGEPPLGPIVGTYFHYNDIRTRWPERFPAIRFVAIHPDPELASELRRFRHRGRRQTVLVSERDAAMAGNIAADLRAVLPRDRFEVTPVVEKAPGAVLATAPAGVPVLFSPRVWGGLSPAQRADPRAIEIRYLIEPKDLAALGSELDWSPRALPRPGAASAGLRRLSS
jgi:GntR family transcriptional regulator